MIVQFRVCNYEKFVRNEYLHSEDARKLNEEQVKEVLSYKGISENFDYCDWYGSCTPVTVMLVKVEQDEWKDFIFSVEVSRSIPAHYVPGPDQILKGKGLLFPTGYSLMS